MTTISTVLCEKILEILVKNLTFSRNPWYESWQDSYQERQDYVRSCNILPRVSSEKLTKVNENKQKPTTTPA